MRRLAALIIAGLVLSAAPAAHALEEDQPGWDCETMGNLICGPVNVERIVALDGSTWVQVWDSHNRVVFGPVLLERIEY